MSKKTPNNETLTAIKAISDLNRIRLILILSQEKELCVCQLTELLGLATATVSRHISLLHAAGMVDSRKEGRWVYYRFIENKKTKPLLDWLCRSLKKDPCIKQDRKTLKAIKQVDKTDLCATQRCQC